MTPPPKSKFQRRPFPGKRSPGADPKPPKVKAPAFIPDEDDGLVELDGVTAKVGPSKASLPSLRKALKAISTNLDGRALFLSPIRSYVPMRHAALGRLLGGPCHPGLPTGVYIEVVGHPSSGKTTLCSAAADAIVNQPPGTKRKIRMPEGVVTVDPSRRVIVFDFEHTLDVDYWRGSIRNAEFLETDAEGNRLNEATANIWIEQPETLEQGLEMACQLVEAAAFDLMIVDSIPSMLPKAVKERSMEEPTVGKHASGLATFFQRMTGAIARNNVTVLMVNQYRDNIGAGPYQKKTRTPGGRAKDYYDSISLELSGPKKTPWFEQGKVCNIRSVKNKVTGVDGEAVQYHIGVGFGLSAEVELAEACDRGKIARFEDGGSVVVMKGRPNERRFPSKRAFLQALRDNDRLFSGLTELCKVNNILVGMAPEEKKGGWGE